METMTHKGYTANIEYSNDDACYIGHVACGADVIGFHADNESDLRSAFAVAVDDYLATCENLNRPI